MKNRPHLWFVCPQMGRPNQVWLQRQLDRIEVFDVTVLCWVDERAPEVAAAERWPVETLAHPFNPIAGWSRRLGLIRRAASGNFFSGDRAEQNDILRIATRKSPDIILAQFGFTALRILPLAQKLCVPMVTHYHGRDLSIMLQNKRYKSSLIKSLPKMAAHIVVGKFQEKWLHQHGLTAHNTHVIPCGVPCEEFTPEPPYNGPLRFLSVGRLDQQKGVDIAIRAFAQSGLARQNAEMRVVGEGQEERSRLVSLAQNLGVEESIVFAGGLPADRIKIELAACSVFLHNATEVKGEIEGFGVAITEASAMERAVIVSDSGGIPDQVIDGVTGFICPQKDVACVTKAMLRLAEDPELRIEMGKAGRKNAIANFDTIGQVRKLEKVLLNAMAASPAAAGKVSLPDSAN